jgi:hypothetical protein
MSWLVGRAAHDGSLPHALERRRPRPGAWRGDHPSVTLAKLTGFSPVNGPRALELEASMTIREIVRQGYHYAITCRWLWLFGFFVGIASGGSNGGAGGGGDGGRWDWVGMLGISYGRRSGDASEAGSGLLDLPFTAIALIASGIILAIAVVTVLRFVGEGALIEGIVRARSGGTMTIREGFRAGWAHWGVLLRIGLLYLGASFGSVALLAVPCVIALQALGPLGGVLVGIPAVLIAVPWLVTLYLVQAFAMRIAVLDNRHALDAIGKARLFLHGRLVHGLKLVAAAFVGTLGIVLVGIAAIAPVALLLAASIPVLRVAPVIVLACLVLLPALGVFAAILGTFRSSVWTIGYVTQVES